MASSRHGLYRALTHMYTHTNSREHAGDRRKALEQENPVQNPMHSSNSRTEMEKNNFVTKVENLPKIVSRLRYYF